ncbi:SCO family protein [Mariluticola halotolerans]|uniref:SCO family protein n=1 Tax=Mariluticola halotolerans TaxID=2909283 RepID=UPI0026E1D0C5|nr:SCO family protein [Mariluticola halotolerans]UJQ95794.1 SCO family protein [Mariluticola halotolerans]
MKETSGLARLRFILWGLVVIVGLGATVLYLVRPPERPVGLYGGTFSLSATTGGTFTQNDLKGVPSLIFFGYTYCPDVCPTTLAESTGWRQRLNLTPDGLRIIFVTVDPERDTLEALTTYLSGFGGQVIGLTGTEAEVEATKKAFGVISEKVENESSTEYLVNHTASVFMIDADGRFDGTIAYGEPTDTALAKVSKLTGL